MLHGFVEYIVLYFTQEGDFMKLLVMSDTHGELRRAKMAVKAHRDVDYILHLGDVGFDKHCIPAAYIVCGNHDHHKYVKEIEMDFDGIHTLMVHGDCFEYELVERMQEDDELWRSWDDCMDILYDSAIKRAKKGGYQMILFGHTHTAFFEERDGVYLCNPGSLCFSHDGRNPSYAIVTVEDGHVSCHHEFLDIEPYEE